MAIEELVAVVAPPSTPLESGNEKAWLKLEKKLRVALPSDLCVCVLRFGTGSFCRGLVEVYSPFSIEYPAILRTELDMLRGAVKGGLPVPYPIYPAAHGLFPWGRDENGGAMYWLMAVRRTSGQLF
jgi:hypothetical protein